MRGKFETATFAGGCFWCMVEPFAEQPGILQIISGYAGVDSMEAVQITFQPEIHPYAKLLERFWQQIDPTDAGGQFNDRGAAYKTAIFYHDEHQRKLAEASKMELAESKRFNKPIVTEILPAGLFTPAEDKHQDYYLKNPFHYRIFKEGSGRADFIRNHWKKRKSDEELRKELTELQYEVTRNNGTEPPFDNAYWDNKRPGIYVDIISAEPLFSSLDQYDAGCGWPSFTMPLKRSELAERFDTSHGMRRIEVRAKTSDAHLGHVFDDGPGPDKARYCINSAALRFIPEDELEQAGYGEYVKLFEK